MRTKLYDPLNDCLIYQDREANEQFWDDKWALAAKITFTNPPRHGLTVSITRRYLSSGAIVLEGGCGLGDVVHALEKAHFAVEGIDYAPKVVQAINANWPHLNVRIGDVRKLDCVDDYYDGYWSFGVIEHFPEGYDAIAAEMYRVLRPGGYLFLSFPSFSPFRRYRAKMGKYPVSELAARDMPDFFQFALDPESVRKKFEMIGFRLIEHRGTCALLGLAEDWPKLASAVGFIERISVRAATGISIAIDRLVGGYAGHSSLLVLQKNEL